jgi:undecaprenyl phosphate N,N'-diacetylbacillosamine 1-phosphate transferase
MNKVYKLFLKRLIDFSVAFILLLILFPLLALIAIVTCCSNRGRVFFLQYRPGLNNRLFPVLKFCTMTDQRDADGKLLPDEERVTSIGRLLRRASLDELPQLVNVLRGEMSLIGPRPQLPEYIRVCNSTQMRRQEVRPGITGLAQINGRNCLDWTERFRYDVYYVDNLSILMDLHILFRTVKLVLRAEGVEYEGTVAENRFTGSVEPQEERKIAA